MLGMLKLQGSGWVHEADNQRDLLFAERENSEQFLRRLKKSIQNHWMASEIPTRPTKLLKNRPISKVCCEYPKFKIQILVWDFWAKSSIEPNTYWHRLVQATNIYSEQLYQLHML